MKNLFNKLGCFLSLSLLILMLSAMTVMADQEGAELVPYAGDGNSSNPYMLSFDKGYTDYPGAPYKFDIPTASVSGSSVWFIFTPDTDGVIQLKYDDTFVTYNIKGSSDYETAVNPKVFAVTKGVTYKLSLSTSYQGASLVFYYHMHYTPQYTDGELTNANQGNCTYTAKDENSCTLTVNCFCKGQSYVTEDAVPEAVTTTVAHKFSDEKKVAPTCTAKGYSYKVCENCGYKKTYSYTNALGHSYTGTISKNNATTHKQACIRCSATKTANHSFTLNANASKKTCSICGYSASTGYKVTYGSLQVTKLTGAKVSLTVSVPTGAKYTEVYCGKKKIKTVKKSLQTFTYSAAKAGTKSYKVRSAFDVNGKIKYSSYSKNAKPKANVYKDSKAGSYKARNMTGYGKSVHKTAKLYYSGKKLMCDAYIYNIRIFTLKKVRIHYTLKAGGKTFKKTITKTVNIGEYGKKKITYCLGSGIVNIRTGITSKSVTSDANWGFGWE